MLLLAGWRARCPSSSSSLLSRAPAVGSRLPIPPLLPIGCLLLFLALQRNWKSYVVVFLVCPACLLPVFVRTSSLGRQRRPSTAPSLFKLPFDLNCLTPPSSLGSRPPVSTLSSVINTPNPVPPRPSVPRRGPGSGRPLLFSSLSLPSVFAKRGLVFSFPPGRDPSSDRPTLLCSAFLNFRLLHRRLSGVLSFPLILHVSPSSLHYVYLPLILACIRISGSLPSSFSKISKTRFAARRAHWYIVLCVLALFHLRPKAQL
jgi:hypothetical protein